MQVLKLQMAVTAQWMLSGICVMLAIAAAAVQVNAEPRIALVVGNGGYASVTQLDNPVSDAQLIAATLEDRGFTVNLLLDANQISLNRSIAQFGRDLRAAGSDATGLFYYAGHGVQSFGSNYLLPVDASLTDAADLGLVAVQANTVLRQMFSAKNKTNIFILDACRNNPFQDIPDLNDNGLAEMSAPTGTFLSYATAPGAVALDGLEGNSPFTKALASQMPTPGLPIEQVFKKVRVEVIAKTNGQQTPWDTSSLTSNFIFEAAAKLSADELAARNLWNSVKASRDPVQIMLFMRGYPESSLMPEARALLSEVMAAEVAPPVKEEPKVAIVEPEKPEAAVDTAAEQDLIGIAQASGKAADYQAYLEAFPNGTYAELADFELDIIRKKAARTDDEAEAEKLAEAKAAAEAEVAKAEAEAAAVAAAAAALPPAELTFTSLLTTGGADIIGKSLEQLITGSPLYPPIEGIPEELWKGQQCSNCHEWTQAALCTQGKTYLTASNERALTKTHPYGGGFKQTIRTWAENDCK